MYRYSFIQHLIMSVMSVTVLTAKNIAVHAVNQADETHYTHEIFIL